jgi:hypothetical protein
MVSQWCWPAGHDGLQAPFTHATEPPAGTSQTVHLSPQAAASSSGRQLSPHRWNPASQTKSQLLLVQVVRPCAGGTQTRSPHFITHAPALQAAVPPAGASHTTQEGPQPAGWSLVTQAPPARQKPGWQEMAQPPCSQTAMPFAGMGHEAQTQGVGALFGQHCPWHFW